MSDSTAFLSGCATAGAAAILVLLSRGSFGESKATFSSPDLPHPITDITNLPPASESSETKLEADLTGQLREDLDDQQALNQRLELQLEQQKVLIDQLTAQLDNQRSESSLLSSQLVEHQRLIDKMTLQQASLADSSSQNSESLQTAVIWTVGGLFLILAIGGSVLLIGVLILLARAQRRSYPPMPVVHPMGVPSPYFYTPQEFLPPKPKAPRYVNTSGYYED